MTSTPSKSWYLAGVVSLAATVTAVLWFARPEFYPYGPDTPVSTGLNAVIPPLAGTAALLVLGVAGLALVLWRFSGRRAAVGAALVGLGFAVVLGDTSLFSSLGYLVAFVVPYGCLALLVVLVKARPRAGMILLGLVVAVAAGLAATGHLGGLLVLYGTYARNTIGSLGDFLSPLVWSWVMAGSAAVWCWTAVADVRSQRTGRPAWMRPPALTRWGRAVTVIAALGAVPYGLLRLTWLTPWPMGGGHGEIFIDELDATTRITGALFVLPCAAAVLLVLGLIRRWGEVFPGWLPIVGGRPVPIRPVVAAGGAVAAAITLCAPGMVVMGFLGDVDPVKAILWQLIFPLYLWGPALAAAVFAYWLRRTAPTEDRIGPEGPSSDPVPTHRARLA